MLNHLGEWLKTITTSPKILHFCLSSSILLTVGIVDLALTKIAINNNKNWTGHVTPENSLTLEDIHRIDNIERSPAEELQLQRIKEIYHKTVIRRHIHSQVMSVFYARYFTSLCLISVTAVASSLSLLFISKEGWEQCSNYVINIFIISTGLVILYGNLMLSLDYEANIASNRDSYVHHSLIIEDILSYLVTNEIAAEERLSLSEFIHYLDQKIEANWDVNLEFNSEESRRIFEEVKGAIELPE